MAAPKRPTLSSIVEPKGRSPEPAPPSKAEATAPAETSEAEPPQAGPADLKTMQVRVNRAGWLEMSRLAQDRDIPLETLMVEAFNDVLTKHRKPPVVERRQPIKR
ncbi:hypothetical protein [Methylobacterium sp. WL7]|uniref:hypothetical protein n=1 Tax=Methylobacterium sp. WL7 TaxID=2603900 RepID=UPI0011CAB181|nr:hypothetical protein [Methylobacterium sp. WL7]TXN42371.1 hypothetical protein FV233_23060 [Methylobacterium sp. WL7]